MEHRYYEGISNNDYHSDKSYFSSSQLKTAIDGPASFRWYLKHGKKADTDWKPDNAMDFGTLVHAILLEPHTIDKDFAFMDTVGRNFRTKIDREYKAKFLANAHNRIVLQAPDLERARMCRDAVAKHEFARELMETKGQVEVSGYFEDEGLKQRFRPDKLVANINDEPAIVDVKTIDNIEQFHKRAKYELSYDLSAYMYINGHLKLTGEILPFYFLVVESRAPHRVAVYKCSEEFLKWGRLKYERAIANVKKALEIKTEEVAFQEANWEMI